MIQWMARVYQQVGAAPQGRWWWEPSALIAMVFGTGMFVEMLGSGLLDHLPYFGQRHLQPAFEGDLVALLTTGDGLTGCGSLAIAVAMGVATLRMPPSIRRGLALFMASFMLLTAYCAFANILVLSQPYYYRLGFLRLLRGLIMAVAGVEFPLHIHELRAAVGAPGPPAGGVPEVVLTEPGVTAGIAALSQELSTLATREPGDP